MIQAIKAANYLFSRRISSILFLADVPGFISATTSRAAGIIRHVQK